MNANDLQSLRDRNASAMSVFKFVRAFRAMSVGVSLNALQVARFALNDRGSNDIRSLRDRNAILTIGNPYGIEMQAR